MSKSIFISIFPFLCLLGIGISIDQNNHSYIWAAVGLGLTSIPMLFFLAKLFLTDMPRTSANLNLYTFFIALGSILLIYAFYKDRAEPIAAIGFILTLFWVLYLRWYSIFPDRTNPLLAKGQKLPTVNFEDQNGSVISSDSFLGKKNIFMFYRGNWCPLCVAQIKEIAKEYRNLEAKGIQTVLISPQSHGHTKNIANKYDVGFKFLIDKNNSVAKQLNIFSKNGLPMGLQVFGYDSDTVMPTIILTNEEGRIIHSDLTSNYRLRPKPTDLITYFES